MGLQCHTPLYSVETATIFERETIFKDFIKNGELAFKLPQELLLVTIPRNFLLSNRVGV